MFSYLDLSLMMMMMMMKWTRALQGHFHFCQKLSLPTSLCPVMDVGCHCCRGVTPKWTECFCCCCCCCSFCWIWRRNYCCRWQWPEMNKFEILKFNCETIRLTRHVSHSWCHSPCPTESKASAQTGCHSSQDVLTRLPHWTECCCSSCCLLTWIFQYTKIKI